MVESPGSRSSLPPAEIVYSKIEENRLFEARFLFGKFSSKLNPAVREKLYQQLTTLITKAEQVFARGEQLERAGKFVKAMEIYDSVAELAVDHPSLAQARQRVEIALQLGPLQADRSPQSKNSDPRFPSLTAQTRGPGSDAPSPSFFQQKKSSFLLGSSLLVTLGLVSILLFFRPYGKPIVERSASVQSFPEIAPEHEEQARGSSADQIEALPGPASGPQVSVPAKEEVVSSMQGTEPTIASSRKFREEVMVSSTEQEEKVEAHEVSKGPELSEKTVDKIKTEGSAPVHQPEIQNIYSVQAGDTLEIIAAKVYGNRHKWSHLVSANKEKLGPPPYPLIVGMQLEVPSLELLEARNGTAVLNADGTYPVQSGDTLGLISRKLYGTSKRWTTLYELNRDQLPTPGSLQVGQELRISKEFPLAGENIQTRE